MVKNKIVVGCQWGDEGKGKVVFWWEIKNMSCT